MGCKRHCNDSESTGLSCRAKKAALKTLKYLLKVYEGIDEDVDPDDEMSQIKGVALQTRDNGVLSGFVVGADAEGLYIECTNEETIFLPYENIGTIYR